MARDQAQLLEMGERIRQLREAHGYKQQWIADQVGVTLRSYQFWQAGHSPPSQESLEKLADLFGVTPKYILQGETPEPFPVNGIEERLAEIKQELLEIRATQLALLAAIKERQRAQTPRPRARRSAAT